MPLCDNKRKLRLVTDLDLAIAYLYSNTTQNVLPNELFGFNGYIIEPEEFASYDSASKGLTILKAGLYEFTYYVDLTVGPVPSQFMYAGINVNGVTIPNSMNGLKRNGIITDIIYYQFIYNAAAGDIFTLVNLSDSVFDSLQVNIGNLIGANISLIVEKLA